MERRAIAPGEHHGTTTDPVKRQKTHLKRENDFSLYWCGVALELTKFLILKFREERTREIMANSQEVLRTAFDRPQWYVSGQAFNIRVRAETIQEFTRGLKPQNILDIGCGDGSLSLPLLERDNHITFLDRSKGMLDLVLSRVPSALGDRIRLVNKDFMEADFGEQTFDLIVCVGVMAYVADRRGFIAKITQLLRPGGTVITECSDAAHFYSQFNGFYEAIRVKLLGGAAFPTIKGTASELEALLDGFGFQERGLFRYSLLPHVTRRFLSQEINYKLIRFLFGSVGRNRAAWAGNECLFNFKRSGISP
jgi:ubiquinone/menaquinone biosynthesis C-methylase UbiE